MIHEVFAFIILGPISVAVYIKREEEEQVWLFPLLAECTLAIERYGEGC